MVNSTMELLIKGRRKKEVLISTYICHPGMANDNLSGILVTGLSAYLKSKKNLKNGHTELYLCQKQ